MCQGETEDTLRRPVATERDTEVQLRPFEVHDLEVPSRWDPEGDPLPVEWSITDRNERIRSGRIRYRVRGPDGEQVTVHTQRLTAEHWRHGERCSLEEGQRWDGTIDEGLTDRSGERVTADLSAIEVEISVWNTTEPDPAPPVPEGRGRTEREGEWISTTSVLVEVDSIVQAEWETAQSASRGPWVVPYGDPEDRDMGEARMRITVHNVRPDTTVRIKVDRINDIADPFSDYFYADSGFGPEDQPGLDGLVVRNGRVVRSDGSAPFVRFNNYDEHWAHPGNNFYCFAVAFGDNGDYMVASQRDHRQHESECLHMRYTVFIHCAANSGEWRDCADELAGFLSNDTNYFRPYRINGSPQSRDRWLSYYRNRYVVVFLGHGSVFCQHSSHPTEVVGGTERFVDLYHRGFEPDRFVCPEGIVDTEEARRDLEWADEEYHHRFGGCGTTSHLFHTATLGQDSATRRRIIVASEPNETTDQPPVIGLALRQSSDQADATLFGDNDRGPRLLFFSAACRSMLSTKLAERFTRNGTRYYHGWVYSVWARENWLFCMDFFHRWIDPPADDPDAEEGAVDRLLPAYRAASAQVWVVSHPRLVEGQTVLATRAAPDEVEQAQS